MQDQITISIYNDPAIMKYEGFRCACSSVRIEQWIPNPRLPGSGPARVNSFLNLAHGTQKGRIPPPVHKINALESLKRMKLRL